MPRGDIVLIRSKLGDPGVRRIWDDSKDRPFVCHEEYWVRWERHALEPVCWQVGRDQVYQYDAALAAELEDACEASRRGESGAADRLEALWKRAQPWAASFRGPEG